MAQPTMDAAEQAFHAANQKAVVDALEAVRDAVEAVRRAVYYAAIDSADEMRARLARFSEV